MSTGPLPFSAPSSLPEGATSPMMPVNRWPCPRCGSDDLASAYLIDYSHKFDYVYLAPRRLKLKRLRNMLRPFRNLIRVDADVCRNCGSVILRVNTEDFEEAERRFDRR
jgi:RNA polymerase subunit RPABC4/transcription elongation factor Spt4